MPKITTQRIVLFLAAVVLVGSAYLYATKEERNYQRITVGMSVEQVEAVLGPGRVIPQAQVIMAGPNYVVRGDIVHNWYFDNWISGRKEVWVAFRDGKVCEKYFQDWNYL